MRNVKSVSAIKIYQARAGSRVAGLGAKGMSCNKV